MFQMLQVCTLGLQTWLLTYFVFLLTKLFTGTISRKLSEADAVPERKNVALTKGLVQTFSKPGDLGLNALVATLSRAKLC